MPLFTAIHWELPSIKQPIFIKHKKKKKKKERQNTYRVQRWIRKINKGEEWYKLKVNDNTTNSKSNGGKRRSNKRKKDGSGWYI